MHAARSWSFQNLGGFFPIYFPVDTGPSPHFRTNTPLPRGAKHPEANMGEVIRFIPKAERERIRLIREARAMYDSVFPSSDSADKTPISHTASGAHVRRGDEALS
jgi:hypothetical protein